MTLYKNEDIVIRLVEKKDIDEVIKIFESNTFNCDYGNSIRPSNFQFRNIMIDSIKSDKKDEAVFIIERNNEILGYLSAFIEYSLLNIGHIAVKKEYQHKGYGKLLMQLAIKVAENENRDIRLVCNYRNSSILKDLCFKTNNNVNYSLETEKKKNNLPKIFMTCDEYKKNQDDITKKQLDEWKNFLNSGIADKIMKL